jgi:hypothetical protein
VPKYKHHMKVKKKKSQPSVPKYIHHIQVTVSSIFSESVP